MRCARIEHAVCVRIGLAVCVRIEHAVRVNRACGAQESKYH